MLQGPYSLDRDKPLFRLPFTIIAVGTVCLALSGLVSCILISLLYHFEESTATHCKVHNYLPSISASISLTPERYIWRFCIGLHSAPRFLVAAAYFNFYRGRFLNRCQEWLLSFVNLLCAQGENLGLLLLTYVSSDETYMCPGSLCHYTKGAFHPTVVGDHNSPNDCEQQREGGVLDCGTQACVHKIGFIVFIASSLIHMAITCRLWQVIKKYSLIPEEQTSYRLKVRLFTFNISVCICAAYFYRRHNTYCEAGVYTFFAFCEYLVVLSNMAFHMTAYWDFGSKEVMIATPPEDKRF
ncbi:post-GPI attachment to proteins factor 2 isoform X2 [Megalops cyprinoides]|nr:post-GPI attachment to proteins factor 2 isoform X2 [Megalops cyprinoides]XP_036379071.1 post-GPI attachment to proteins factor 2 isoform X2 [Megalops cyprinoides]